VSEPDQGGPFHWHAAKGWNCPFLAAGHTAQSLNDEQILTMPGCTILLEKACG
jgi:hypothetical protein